MKQMQDFAQNDEKQHLHILNSYTFPFCKIAPFEFGNIIFIK